MKKKFKVTIVFLLSIFVIYYVSKLSLKLYVSHFFTFRHLIVVETFLIPSYVNREPSDRITVRADDVNDAIVEIDKYFRDIALEFGLERRIEFLDTYIYRGFVIITVKTDDDSQKGHYSNLYNSVIYNIKEKQFILVFLAGT